MILSATKINCKGKSEINTNNYYVTRDNINSRQCKSPQTYSDSWYVRESHTYGRDSKSGAVDKQQEQQHTENNNNNCWCCLYTEDGIESSVMRYNNGPQSAASMVASYGVYNDTNMRRSVDDEDGFMPRANVYRGVVVNASGDSTVVRSSHHHVHDAVLPDDTDSCGWCFNSQTSSNTPRDRNNACLSSWCRPTLLLLFLVLLVVVFILVSGILLYYNCRLMMIITFNVDIVISIVIILFVSILCMFECLLKDYLYCL